MSLLPTFHIDSVHHPLTHSTVFRQKGLRNRRRGVKGEKGLESKTSGSELAFKVAEAETIYKCQ